MALGRGLIFQPILASLPSGFDAELQGSHSLNQPTNLPHSSGHQRRPGAGGDLTDPPPPLSHPSRLGLGPFSQATNS